MTVPIEIVSYSSSTKRFCRRFACLATMRSVASAIVRQDRPNQDLRLDNRESIKGPFVLRPRSSHNWQVRACSHRISGPTKRHGVSHEDDVLERVNATASLRSRSSVYESIIFPHPTMPRLTTLNLREAGSASYTNYPSKLGTQYP